MMILKHRFKDVSIFIKNNTGGNKNSEIYIALKFV